MKRPEQALHKACADFARLTVSNDVLWFHVPNGGGRSAIEGAILKGLGTLAGVPDLTFIWRGNNEEGVKVGFIEFKALKGKLTESQSVFRCRCTSVGVQWEECRSVDRFKEILKEWGVPMKRGK